MMGGLVVPSKVAQVGLKRPNGRELVSVMKGSKIRDGVTLIFCGNCLLKDMTVGGAITPGPPRADTTLSTSLFIQLAVGVRSAMAPSKSITVKIMSGTTAVRWTVCSKTC